MGGSGRRYEFNLSKGAYYSVIEHVERLRYMQR